MRDSSERLMALLRGETVDRPPYWEPWFAMGQMLQQRYGGDYITMADDLGHAAMPVGGCGHGMDFSRRLDKRLDTGVWYGGGRVFTRDELHQCPMPDHGAQLHAALPKRERCRNAGLACWMTLPWCFHAIATQMGLENFCLTLFDDPALVKESLAEVERRNAVAIERVIAAVRPDFILYDGDCAYRNGTMIHPDQMRELTYDITRPNIQRLAELGIPAAFHSDGQLDGVIPLVADLGFTAVHGCEAQANDLAHLVKTFGDRICLCGNMDVVFLHTAKPPEVEAATRRMLATGFARRRFVAGCNTSPMDYIPVENDAALTRAVAQWEG